MTERILAIIQREAKGPVTRETHLDQLGLDSLDTTDLILQIEKEIGIDIESARLGNIQTVGQLAAAFLGKAHEC